MSKRRISQNQKVLRYLQTHKRGLTQRKADDLFGVERLSGRIYDLRHEGYDIKTTMIAVKNRYGDTCHVASYTLGE